MSVLVRLDGDGDAVKKAQAVLSGVEGGIEKAVMRSMNRALSSGKTALVKGVKSTYEVNDEPVRDAVKVRRASVTRLAGSIDVKGKALSARHFAHDPAGKDTTGSSRKTVRIAIKKGKTSALKTGFIWDGGWGTEKHAIYLRSGGKVRATKGRHAGKKYMVDKLKKMTGPSVPQMAGNEEVSEAVEKRVQEIFERRLTHETNRILKGK
jgi:hypothetical protein